MLNPFPELLTYQFVLITFLRIVLAVLFLIAGSKVFSEGSTRAMEFFKTLKFPFPKYFTYALGIIEIIGGALLFVGAFVQYVAIALSAITFTALLLKDRKLPYLKNDFAFYILLFVLTFSLIFFGAGAFAFDIPL